MRILPSGVELVRDISPADWVMGRLRPWLGRRGAVKVGSIVPVGFEAYGRIQHEDPHEDAGSQEGDVPPHQMSALVRVLTEFTATPRDGWFCVWSGYGFWFLGSHGISILGAPEEEARELKAEYQRRSEERDRLLRRMPTVQGEGRDYFLFSGPISAAPELEFDGYKQSPNLWWPEDRAWCVGTGIDLSWTYVASSPDCIARLVNDSVVKAATVNPDDDIV